MKVYSIGREVGCDIVINDSTDVISRRHAILNVTSSGKMTIVDQSHNGTYVNGIRISQNVPVPVTRKDNVSFAHVARLDWNMVPKSTNPMMYAIIAVIALIVIGGSIVGYNYFGNDGGGTTATSDTTAINQKNVDSLKVTLKEKISEATGLKSAITNKTVADTLDAAIKSAQETYDNSSATKENVIAATETLQKAIDVAKVKQTAHPSDAKQKGQKSGDKQGKKVVPKPTPKEKTCGTCKKPLSQCEYKGKHPTKKTSRGDH